MKLEDINKKLESISTSLDKIEWSKELEAKVAKEVDDKINGIDSLTQEDEFGKKQLDDAVAKLNSLYEKAKDGASKADIDKETIDSINRKTGIRDNIKSKYDFLFKQKEIIEQYIKNYDPKNMIDIKNDKIEKNNATIKEKKELKSKIENFKDKKEVKCELENIDKLQKENEVIEKALKEIKSINDLEAKKNKVSDPEFKNKFEEQIDKKKKNLESILNSVRISYVNDMSVLESSLKSKKTKNDKEMSNSVAKIRNELKAEKDKDLDNALGINDKTKSSEIREIFNNAYHKIGDDIIKLNRNNTNLQADIKQMNDDLELEDVGVHNSSPNYPPTKYVPTDDEIKNDPDYKMAEQALVPTTKKDKIKSRKEYLRDKAKIPADDKKWHPMIWLKSHFATGKLDKEMTDARIEEAKKKVKDKLIAARQQQENAVYDARVNAQDRKDFKRDIWVGDVTRSVLEGRKDGIESRAYENAADKEYSK